MLIKLVKAKNKKSICVINIVNIVKMCHVYVHTNIYNKYTIYIRLQNLNQEHI